MSSRIQRLANARLYLVCDRPSPGFLEEVLPRGVDVVQLRMKRAPDEEILEAAGTVAEACAEYGALFILNDRPDLVVEAQADGVHLGQDDLPIPQARELVGRERLIGLSTHSAMQVRASGAQGADYIGVGPVHATPTKPGRPPVGLGLVRYAATHATVPFFAIGGISPDNVEAVRAAGARRIAIVRALTEAAEPGPTAARLRHAITRQEAPLGAAQP